MTLPLEQSLRRDLMTAMDRSIAALLQAKPKIDAAERLAARLTEAGVQAHAHGHFASDQCTTVVLTEAAPARVEVALISMDIDFVVTDILDTPDYKRRALRATVDGFEVEMVIDHQPALDGALAYRERTVA